MKPNHDLSAEFLNSSYRKYFDLAYETMSQDQKLDLWLPDEPAVGPYPVLMYFHGGAFKAGAKRENQSEPVLRALERGYAVADVDYRKSGEAVFPAMLLDAKAAVRFLRAHAAEYDLDPDRIAAWGASAGGWIVSMLGVSTGMEEFANQNGANSDQSDAVQAVVDWCGPCGDFLLMDSDFEEGIECKWPHNAPGSAESLFMGAPLTEIPERCRAAAPYTYAHADVPPFLIVHGTADNTVPTRQSVRFHDALVKAAGEERVELRVLEGVPHHSKPWNNDPVIAGITMEFLDRVFKK